VVASVGPDRRDRENGQDGDSETSSCQAWGKVFSGSRAHSRIFWSSFGHIGDTPSLQQSLYCKNPIAVLIGLTFLEGHLGDIQGNLTGLAHGVRLFSTLWYVHMSA
jgi:hypothetical protein